MKPYHILIPSKVYLYFFVKWTRDLFVCRKTPSSIGASEVLIRYYDSENLSKHAMLEFARQPGRPFLIRKPILVPTLMHPHDKIPR